jgi:negative regulator of sigma E activity
MSDGNDSSELERRAKRAFDDSVAALDGATRSRLTQARHRALDEHAQRRDRGWLATLAPAGAAAAMALVAWFVVWQQPPTTEVVQEAALGDLEILLGEEDLEMLDEELEFYGWLEEQPEFENAGDSVG